VYWQTAEFRIAPTPAPPNCVRSNAIEALGFCGEQQDLALLDQLATDFMRHYPGSDWTSEQNNKSSLTVIHQTKSRIEARLRK
jgi:hypothetical protein